MSLTKRRWALLHSIHAILGAIYVGQRIRLMDRLRHVTSGTMRGSHGLTSQRHIDKTLLAVATEVIHLFALELVLNTLAVRRITNQREDRTNPFDKKGTLSRLSIVQGGLAGRWQPPIEMKKDHNTPAHNNCHMSRATASRDGCDSRVLRSTSCECCALQREHTRRSCKREMFMMGETKILPFR